MTFSPLTARMTSPVLSSARAAGPFGGDADRHDLVLDLGRVHPEPGPRRLVDAAELAQIVEHRLEQIDRHDHVEMLASCPRARARAAASRCRSVRRLVRDQPGAAPIGMRGSGEDRLVQHDIPNSRRIPAWRRCGRRASGCARRRRRSPRARRVWRRREEPIGSRRDRSCRAPAPGRSRSPGSKPSAWPSTTRPSPRCSQTVCGFGDQIADGQHQAVVDQHAVAGALGAQRLGGEGVGRDDRMQADHRGKRAIEIETVVAPRAAVRKRHFPFGQRGHRDLRGPIGVHVLHKSQQRQRTNRRRSYVANDRLESLPWYDL